MKSLLLPLLAVLALPNNVIAADINCESPVWKNKPICLQKKSKEQIRPDFCKDKNLTPMQEEVCIGFDKRKVNKNNANLKYPISLGGNRRVMRIIEFLPPNEFREEIKYINELIQFRSADDSELTIAKGKEYSCLFSCEEFKELSKFSISPKNIIGWSKNGETKSEANAAKTWGAVALFVNPTAIFLTPFGFSQKQIDYYQIIYFDDQGLKKDFYFLHDFASRNPNILDRYLEKITSLKSGEIRSDDELRDILLISLSNLEKEATRLENILIESNDIANECVSYKNNQYPNLFNKYQELKISISELRTRLEIVPISNQRKICIN